MTDTSDFIPVNDTSDFVPVASPTVTTPQTSAAEAGGRGFANTSSFGLGKWVNGVLGASLNRVYSATGQTPDAIDASVMSSTPNTGKGFWADVTNSVEGQKAANEVAQSQHPFAYVAGSVVGAAPQVALTGGATTAARSIAISAGLGAEGGAAESTTGTQLARNATTGAVLGGGLSAIPVGVSALVTKFGTSEAAGLLKKTVGDATSSNPIDADAGLDKLKGLYPGIVNMFKGTKNSDAQLNQTLIDTASEHFADLKAGKPLTDVTSAIVKKIAPTLPQVGGDVVKALPGAAAITYGAQLGHQVGGNLGSTVAGAVIPTIFGAAKPLGTLAKDVADYGAMRYAGAPALQQGVRQISPLAGGNLGGTLGSYLDQYWSVK